MKDTTVCYDGYNQTSHAEVCFTLRNAIGGGAEGNDAMPKVCIPRSRAFRSCYNFELFDMGAPEVCGALTLRQTGAFMLIEKGMQIGGAKERTETK